MAELDDEECLMGGATLRLHLDLCLEVLGGCIQLQKLMAKFGLDACLFTTKVVSKVWQIGSLCTRHKVLVKLSACLHINSLDENLC